jgi:hypothetical protein
MYHLSVDSFVFQPVCPTLGMWFSYGVLTTTITVVFFFLHVRNSIGLNFTHKLHSNAACLSLHSEFSTHANSLSTKNVSLKNRIN